MITCQACGCETKNGMACEICGSKLIDIKTADRLTKRYTACNTFAELAEMMGEPGNQKYSPSIYPNNVYKGRKIPGKVKLIEICRRSGYKVYDGEKVA